VTGSGRPIGPIVDATPAERPGPVTFDGRFCRVETLDPTRHGDQLWRAFEGHDAIWDYMAPAPFVDGLVFAKWLDERAVLLDPFHYVVVDKPSGLAVGIVTLMEIRPAMRVVEMGSIVYSPALQRRPAATEAQYLVARHVFETLHYRRYEWKCNALNAASKRAAGRLGFTYEGLFRQHMIVKGRNRDTAWFSMLDSEWPARREAFERWLDPANFDSEGRQRVSLSALNASTAYNPAGSK
jgi:RimJ/RimL family protein N-acetyltransferase